MPVGSEIKGSKLKSFVNRLNLLKVLIVSSASFFSGMRSLFIRFFIFIFIILVCNYLCSCSGNSETIYSTANGRYWLPPSRKCTSRNVELNGSFFVRSIFVKLFQCFILCFKVTSLCFLLVVILNTIHKQFSFMH